MITVIALMSKGILDSSLKSHLINAKKNGITKEEMAEITQDKFNEMFKVAMNAYRAELQDNDCGNFSADGRKFVEETGLLVGGSKLPNGEANFMWQDFLTREQFATVLYRFAQKFGLS